MRDIQTILAALLQQRTPVTFHAQGPSMHPTIRDGDGVLIQPLDVGTIHRGSVILYQINGRLVLHRCTINEKRTNRVFAVGDAAVKGGDWIPKSDVIGVAASSCQNGKIRLLDTRRARWTGLLRFALRPLRRMLIHFRQAFHAQAPAPRNS